MITLYGIANCDTMKKARRWLDTRGIDYVFHDYGRQGLTEAQLRAWVAELGWESLLNRRGTTWRKLPEEVRESIDEEAAIRGGVHDTGSARHLGFSEAAYAEIFP